MNRRSFLMLALSSSALAGCSTLPANGPQSWDVDGAASGALKAGDGPAFKYILVDLTREVLAALRPFGPGSLFRSFGAGRGGPPQIRVGVGDTIQVTIFESAAGGLFIPAEAGSRSGNFVTLPPQTVDQAGFISVPYAGAIRARGRSLGEIQQEIEQKLSNRAIEPQAVVNITSSASSQVTVIGQVGAPSKVNINPAGDRVLDVIARASGIANPGFETFVTLQRGGREETIYFLNMISDAKENIFVAPGDIIYVYQQQRAFTAFGASGQSGQFKFEQEHLTLADAVGKAGGLIDGRADPSWVLLYRHEYREVLEKLGLDLKAFAPEERRIPTVFRANFRDASSFFVATSLMMQDRDVLYVTNAQAVELFKFLELVNNVSGTISGVSSDVVTTRNAVRRLGR